MNRAIVVGEEVGWGIVPVYASARVFRDVLGRLQQTIAARASRVYLVVSGFAIDLRTASVPIAADAVSGERHRLRRARRRAQRRRRVCRCSRQLEHADVVILPGTKDTLGALRWLDGGMGEAVIAFAQCKPVIGICGGYQILGLTVADPHGVEAGGARAGLGLVGVRTILTPVQCA